MAVGFLPAEVTLWITHLSSFHKSWSYQMQNLARRWLDRLFSLNQRAVLKTTKSKPARLSVEVLEERVGPSDRSPRPLSEEIKERMRDGP